MFERDRLTVKRLAVLGLAVTMLFSLCACSSPVPQEPAAAITPSPILAELPLLEDGTVDYAAYIKGEWVSTEPVLDGGWYLAAKYVDGGIAGLRAAKPKGSAPDYSQWNEDNWVFGDLTPGTYEVTGDVIYSVINDESGSHVISWEYLDQMVLDDGISKPVLYYRVA